MSKQTLRLLLVFTTLVLQATHLFAARPVPASADKTHLSGPVASVLPGMPRYAPDRLLVKFRPGAAASVRGRAHRQAGGKQLGVISGIDVHVVEVPAGSVPARVSLYLKNPNVEYAEPDFYRVLISMLPICC